MPFLKDFIINNSTKIILWKIIPGELDDKHISKEEIDLLKIRKEKKSKEYFLAARKLLKNEDSELTIEYDSKGKPYLNKEKGISISHSNEIVAIGISNETHFGIDIQYKTDKIFKVKSKFLSKKEGKFLGKTDNMEFLIKIWSAKESIFKALGREGVSFSNDLEIDTINDIDLFREAYYKKDNIKIKFNLDFLFIEEYVICYAKKS